MKGPAPKPTALKRLAGNPGKRPLGVREAQPRRHLPRCPDHVQGTARAEWKRMAKSLYDAGLLTEVDRPALEAYCVTYGRWVEAEKLVTEKGPIIKTTNGNIVQNPFLGVANRALEQMIRFCAEFGMTPSSRTRIKIDKVDEPTSLAEMLFTGADELVNG